MRYTRRPWELVAVDDGPPDGTAEYLAGVVDAAPVPVTILPRVEGRGVAAALNRGLEAARGDHLVLLNNDAVVTDAWLDMLAALADSSPTIGMAGPMSNHADPPQRVADASYDGLDAMHQFASRFRDEHRGEWLEAPGLSGTCLLMKRTLLDAVGELDEGFRTGRLAAADLALRARDAGFTLAVARDLFVHDFGFRASRGVGKEAQAPLDADRRLFREKWGDRALPGRPRTSTPQGPPSHAATAPTPARPTVSLTMIVRDEERNLPACLGSAEGLFDEIIVVDTGSADRTKEVARSFGARVFDFPWIDDFAAARNEALDRANGDYAFWLDADDLLEPPERDKLRALLAALPAGDEAAATVVRCACDPGPDGGGGATVVDHVRLFPLRGDVRWEYAVHEQILPALRRAGIPVRWSDVVVRHTGYADPALRSRKLDRDERILERERRARPRDPFVLFNLGQVAVERRRWSEALAHLNASLALSAPGDSITRKLHALIARSHQMRGEVAEALAACNSGLAGEPDDAELLFRSGVLHRLAGDDDRAEACWIRVLGARRGDRFGSLDVGIYGHVTRRNLAALAERRGDARGAARHWAGVLAERPGDSEAVAALARLAGPGRDDAKRAE